MIFHYTVVALMQWRLGAARRIWALNFLLSRRLNASRHFLANFLVVVDYFLHLNFTDCFGGKGLALDSNNDLQILFKPLLLLSHQVSYIRMCIAPANAVYHQCLQCRSVQVLFNLPIHHRSQCMCNVKLPIMGKPKSLAKLIFYWLVIYVFKNVQSFKQFRIQVILRNTLRFYQCNINNW